MDDVGPGGIGRIAHCFDDPRATARCLLCATDGTIETYTWDFGDGTGAEGPRVTHTYIRAGEYIVMLTVVRDRIQAMIDDGKSLEEVVAAKPTAEFDEQYGDPTMLVDRAYASLVQ